jgi:hypothetical protein
LIPIFLKELREWAEEARITEELYDKSLYTDGEGNTVLQVGADRNIVEILEKLRRSLKRK